MNGPAPERLSRRGGGGRWPGSICRESACAAGRGAGGSSAPAVNLADLQPAPTVHSAPLPPRPEPGPRFQPASRSKRNPWCTLQSLETLPEPFPRPRQVSGGPENLADKSPRRGWQPPAAAAGSPRRASRIGAQRSRARARARPRVTFGRSQVSPPVLAAAQPHGSCAA